MKKKLSTSNNTVGFYNSEKFICNRFFKDVTNESEGENRNINNKSNLEYINSNYEDSDSEENIFCSEISDNKKNNKKNYIYMPNHDDLRISDFLENFLYFYGFEFDYINYGISLNGENFGKTYKKFY